MALRGHWRAAHGDDKLPRSEAVNVVWAVQGVCLVIISDLTFLIHKRCDNAQNVKILFSKTFLHLAETQRFVFNLLNS